MGTDFALACSDCLEFIALHKWSIIDQAAKCLIKAHYDGFYGKLQGFPQPNQFKIITKPELSNQLLVLITAEEITQALENFVPPQPYIEELLPAVLNFVSVHSLHSLFLTCDIGEQSWDFGEPQCFSWKEISVISGYHAQFLPRNLIEDFGFFSWHEVLDYYHQHESWFLHEQLKGDRRQLRQAFEQELLRYSA
ncbi:MAG: hypothetical protein AAFQ80_13550 [Cyanobacteria bacterium J06621_8]